MKIPDLDRYRIEDDELHKQCNRCQEFWPCDPEFFFTRQDTTDGLAGDCKAATSSGAFRTDVQAEKCRRQHDRTVSSQVDPEPPRRKA